MEKSMYYLLTLKIETNWFLVQKHATEMAFIK